MTINEGKIIINKSRKTFWFLLFMFILFLGGAVFIYICFIYVLPPDNFPVAKVVTIEKGVGLKQVAADFEEKNLIRSAYMFEIIGWVLKKEKEIKAGEYFFEKPLNVWEMIEEITRNGVKEDLVPITIPEGYALRDIAAVFEESGMWETEDFLEITGLPAVDCRSELCISRQDEFIKPESLISEKPAYVSMEGYLFPDTYYVPVTISPEAMLKMMLENFEKKMSQGLRSVVAESGYTFFEILTMASIIEEEAGIKEDRELISGVLWKRLDAGMPLQVDAVFPYIIGKNSYQLTTEDLKIDSPYNTYLYKGLPLGPITNPGLESIKAALFPKESPFWFYLSDKEGNTYYSITYDEHLIKKEKHIK